MSQPLGLVDGKADCHPPKGSQRAIPELFGRDSAPSVSAVAKIFGFPNPVNETSARIVAAGAVTMSVLFLVTQNGWVLVPLTYGFWARVLAGPRFSPLGRLATQVITPRLSFDHKFTAGPPKRFAQGMGTAFTTIASVLWILDLHFAAGVTIAMLAAAASLEAFAGFCCGCAIFSQLMKWNLVPESVCLDCADISRRVAAVR